MTHPHCKPPGRQSGVAAIEFAFVLPLLLLIVAGVIEFGRTLWYMDALTKGTRDAARYLSTIVVSDLNSGTTASETKQIVVQAAARAGVPKFNANHVSVSCSPSCNAATPTAVTVSVVNYSVTVGGWFPLIPVVQGGFSGQGVSLAPRTTMPYLR